MSGRPRSSTTQSKRRSASTASASCRVATAKVLHVLAAEGRLGEGAAVHLLVLDDEEAAALAVHEVADTRRGRGGGLRVGGGQQVAQRAQRERALAGAPLETV